MTVESASYISQLDATLPAAGDQKSEGDDHFRLIKSVLKTQFPNFGTTAITTTAAEVNFLSGVTSAIQTQINAKASLASPAFTGVPTVPTATPGTSDTQAASTAFVAATAFASALPAQAGNAGKYVTTNGTTASWADAATLASNTFTGAQVYSDQQLSRGMTKDMGIVFLDKGNSGTSAQTLDYSAASHQKLTVTGAFVMNAVTNWPPTGNTGELLLELVNGASSAITWTMSGTTQKWWKADGTSVSTYAASGYTLQSSGTDWLLLWSTDAGTTTNIKVMR